MTDLILYGLMMLLILINMVTAAAAYQIYNMVAQVLTDIKRGKSPGEKVKPQCKNAQHIWVHNSKGEFYCKKCGVFFKELK